MTICTFRCPYSAAPLQIVLAEPFPELGEGAAETCYAAEAEKLADALVRTLPFGVLARLLDALPDAVERVKLIPY